MPRAMSTERRRRSLSTERRRRSLSPVRRLALSPLRRQTPHHGPYEIQGEKTPRSARAGSPRNASPRTAIRSVHFEAASEESPEASMTNLAKALQQWFEKSERRACAFNIAKAALRASGVTTAQELPIALQWLNKNIDLLEHQTASVGAGSFVWAWFPGLWKWLQWLEPANQTDIKNFQFWTEDKLAVPSDEEQDEDEDEDEEDTGESAEKQVAGSDDDLFDDPISEEPAPVSPAVIQAKTSVSIGLQRYLAGKLRYKVAHRCFMAWRLWAQNPKHKADSRPQRTHLLKRWYEMRNIKLLREWRDIARIHGSWKRKMNKVAGRWLNMQIAMSFDRWQTWAFKRIKKRKQKEQIMSKIVSRLRNSQVASAFFRWSKMVRRRRKARGVITAMSKRQMTICYRRWKDYTLRKMKKSLVKQMDREREWDLTETRRGYELERRKAHKRLAKKMERDKLMRRHRHIVELCFYAWMRHNAAFQRKQLGYSKTKVSKDIAASKIQRYWRGSQAGSVVGSSIAAGSVAGSPPSPKQQWSQTPPKKRNASPDVRRALNTDAERSIRRRTQKPRRKSNRRGSQRESQAAPRASSASKSGARHQREGQSPPLRDAEGVSQGVFQALRAAFSPTRSRKNSVVSVSSVETGTVASMATTTTQTDADLDRRPRSPARDPPRSGGASRGSTGAEHNSVGGNWLRQRRNSADESDMSTSVTSGAFVPRRGRQSTGRWEGRSADLALRLMDGFPQASQAEIDEALTL